MKLQDFGLWFSCGLGPWCEWSTKIPPKTVFQIFYDGICLGIQWPNYVVTIFESKPYLIKFNTLHPPNGSQYLFNRLLTLDDFEIIPNPDYLGKQ